MNPVIFSFGPFTLHWYGVFIVGGAVLATWLAARTAAKAGQNPDHVWNMLAFALIFGIIGARLYHVFSSPANSIGWEYYREHPEDIFAFWKTGGFAGLGIYGGLVGGILAIAGYAWIRKLDLLMYLDFLAPNVLLAQAVGRMGNFINQELYGPPTNLPWAFHINPEFPCQTPGELPAGIQTCAPADALTQQTRDWYASFGFHPTFFYEALWNLVMFALLTFVFRRYGNRFRKGDGVLLYFIAYPLGRFWVEMFRPDAWVTGSLPTAQWIALGLIAVAAIILVVRHIGWNWREHPEQSMIYMQGVNPDELTPKHAEAAA
ncbi:MAG: prolipoprotein diacylglyceryl transferase [Anaerolineales bacterium]|nr:prolipoprotein diacylglyceryl transferase [Anaerolineales bacterium]